MWKPTGRQEDWKLETRLTSGKFEIGNLYDHILFFLNHIRIIRSFKVLSYMFFYALYGWNYHYILFFAEHISVWKDFEKDKK